MEPATKQDISKWFADGKLHKASHLVVVCDEFDYSDYPVYVYPPEDARSIVKTYSGKEMQRVMEVYRLDLPLKEQLEVERNFQF